MVASSALKVRERKFPHLILQLINF